MIHVFHATQAVVAAMQMMGGADVSSIVTQNIGNYEHVAEVMVESPEMAKSLTTHVDNNWWENDKVHEDMHIGMTVNARSTKEGDLLIKEDEAYLVTTTGLEKLEGIFSVTNV